MARNVRSLIIGSAFLATSSAFAQAPLIEQSYVAGDGAIDAYGDVVVVRDATTVGGVPIHATNEALRLGAGYGITDQLTAGIDYAAPMADSDKGRGPLSLFGTWSLVQEGALAVAAAADFQYDVCGTLGAGGNCAVAKTIHVGLGAKYKLTPAIAIFTGTAPYSATGSLANIPAAMTTGAPVGPGRVAQQLSVSLEHMGPVTLDVPVGVAVQASEHLFAYLDTNLAQVRLANAPTGANRVSPIFSSSSKDGIGVPIELGAFCGVTDTLHVGLNFWVDDLLHPSTLDSAFLSARFFSSHASPRRAATRVATAP